MSDDKEANALDQEEVVCSIKTNLTCQVCDKLFVDPKVLPCLHTFCCLCIENLLRNRPLKDKLFKCPSCHFESGLDSRNSVRKLPANSLLVSLLDLLRIQEGEAIQCDVCDCRVDESPADLRCRECSVYLCELHVGAHKRAKDTKRHVLLSLEHLKTMSLKELNRPTYCATHTDERLALFCDTCNESICRNCALKDHKTHQTQFLEDAYSKLYPRLSQILEQTRSVCIKVEKAVPALEWMQTRVNMKADGIIRDIEDSINTKIKALEQRKSELRAAVELVRVNRKTALDVQRRRLEASREALQVSCRFVKRVLEEGDPVYLLSAKDLMSERLEALANQHYELQPREDHVIKFSAENVALQQAIESFGSIDTSYPYFATSTAEGPGLHEANVNQTVCFTVITRDRKGRPIECVTSDLSVQIESPDGAFTEVEITSQNSGKHNISYVPLVPGQHLIHISIRSYSMNGSPFTVNVPFAMRDYENMTQPQLLIGGHGEEAGKLKGARGVTVDKENRIVVCDRNNFRVQIFDSSGKFLFAFGNKGSGNGEFPGGPLSVAVSNDGRFFVSDWSGRTLQMFDAKGKFVKRLRLPEDEDEKCAKLSNIVFSQKELQVYITDGQNRKIYVFDSGGEYLSHFQVGCLDEDDGLPSKLQGVTINRKGEIVVSLVNDGALQVLSTDGKPLRHIPLPFTKSSKVFAPEAITVDSNDNILMADSMRNCLLVFSGEDGHLLAECARESLCNPYGVAVDRVGRVIMTDSSNQIKIF